MRVGGAIYINDPKIEYSVNRQTNLSFQIVEVVPKIDTHNFPF